MLKVKTENNPSMLEKKDNAQQRFGAIGILGKL